MTGSFIQRSILSEIVDILIISYLIETPQRLLMANYVVFGQRRRFPVKLLKNKDDFKLSACTKGDSVTNLRTEDDFYSASQRKSLKINPENAVANRKQ